MTPILSSDFPIVAHVLLALFLGWLLGYERYSHGRAAGTQVYCLVCTAACALTAASGQLTNFVGSILTGIGFLGAGIIVKSGTSIRGLTTAASVWSSAAIGILVGLGHYVAAACVTALFIACMVLVPRMERRLRVQIALEVSLRYRQGHRPQEGGVHAFLHDHGLAMVTDSLSVTYEEGAFQFRFLVITDSMTRGEFISRVAGELPGIPHVESFSIEQTNRA
ncbi:MgtC/SapB family protein [Dokdonella sp.]|uniref:MgtC/SapB family protein n=1 Tax=Dokdonella sp. TaxID=2291710 RepID=UPI001B2AB597|nr:MgtC/SapB family protein [Dokdonella sp.]MBO9664207.1 MgtC/SapB family protein [Dokdonella sp.]